MRSKVQQIMRSFFITDKKEIESIINQCEICFVGMVTSDGSPYVVPMNFGYFDGHIVLHSAPEGSHLHYLEKNNRVCITICNGGKLRFQHPDMACSYNMEAKSVMCKGTISFIENNDEKVKYLDVLMSKFSDKKFKYSEPSVRNVKVWLVKIDEMTAKAVGQNYKN